MFYLFILLLILPPLTYYGLDQQWTSGLLEAGIGVLLLLLVFAAFRNKRPVFAVPGLLPLGCYCFLILLQLIPIPPFLLSILSPAAFEHYQETVWLFEPELWMPVTIRPEATLAHFLRFFSYTLFFVTTIQILRTSERLKKTVIILSFFGGIYAFFGLLQFFVPGARIFWVLSLWPEYLSHAFGGYVNGNHYAGLMEMLFPLALTGFFLLAPKNSYGTWRDRLADFASDPAASKHVLVGLAAVFIAVSILFSLSRGGTISFVLSTLLLLGLLFFQAKTRSRAMFSILVLIAVIGLVGLFGLEPVLDRFDNVFDSTGELTDQRPIYWKNSLELIGDFSLLGSGGGSFVDSYMGYQSINTGERVVNHAHNDYLELLAEGGWLSFMLVTWFLISLLKKTWPAWKKRRNSTSRYLYPGAICGIVAILCHSVTDFNFAILPNGLFFFFLCGLLVAAAHVRSDRSGKGCDLPKISPGRILLLVAAGFLLMFGSILFHGGTLWARHICPPVAELNLAQYGTAKRLSYLEKIKTAAVYDPLNSHYRYAESYYLRSLNQIPAALTALQTAVKLRPYHGLYLQQLGQLASFQGHQEFAGQLLSNAIRVQPRLFSAHMEYGAWLFSQQRHEEAFDAFRQGIQQQPEQTGQILTLLALFRVESQQMEQVLPERSLGWQIYAEYLVALQQDMIAEAAFQKGVVLAAKEVPAITKPYWAYFNYLRKRHRHSEALTLMLDGIKNFPENGGFHSNAGVLYEQQGIIYRAMEEYQQTLLIDPQRTWVRQRLEKLQRKQ